MTTLLVVLAAAVLVWSPARADHLQVGRTANWVVLAHLETVQYNAIPFMKRVKQFFYSDPSNNVIQGIQALDELHSKASANITAGGVGYPFVNIRLKSEMCKGLSYNIGIYVLPKTGIILRR